MRSNWLLIVVVVAALAVAYFLAAGDPLGLLGGSGRDAGSGTAQDGLEAGGAGDAGAGVEAGGEARGPTLFGSEALRRRGLGAVRGRVLDVRTGKGVTGATLLLTGVGHGKEPVAARASSAADGTFALAEVAAGEGLALRIEAVGVGVRSVPGVEVLPGQSSDLGDLWLGKVGTTQGMAVDGAGQPVAGAEVPRPGGASTLREFFAGGGFLDFFRNLDREPEPLSKQESKSDGTFRFEAVSPGPHTLLVRAPLFRQAIMTVTLTGEGAVEQVTVRLGVGGTLSGTVADAQGKALGGVTLVAMSEEDSVPSPLARTFARSKDDGTFLFTSLMGEGRQMLIAAAPGYPNTMLQVESGDQGVRMVLRRGATLELRLLRDGDGTPIEGAQLLCSVGEGTNLGDSGPSTLIPGTTDRAGVAVVEAPPGVLQMLIVSHSERPPAFWASQRGMVMPGMLKGPKEPTVPEGRSQMTFRATDGVWLVGRVLDTEKRPLAGAEVNVLSFMGGATPVLSAADGSFRLAAERTSSSQVRATLVGWVQEKTDVANPGAGATEDVAEMKVDIIMRAAVAVSGRVLAPDGTPLGGATVVVRKAPGQGNENAFDMTEFMGGAPTTLTLADGSYVVDGVPAGKKVRVQARREGLVDGGTAVFEVAEAGVTSAPDVHMLAGASVEVRVEAADGRRIAGARVRVEVKRDDGVEGDRFEQMMEVQSGRQDLRTGANGEVSIPLLPPGALTVRVSAPGHAPWGAKAKILATGAPQPPIVVKLPPGIELSGKVLDGQGQPLADVRVQVLNLDPAPGAVPSDDPAESSDWQQDWDRSRRATTARDGLWKLGDLPDRPLQLRLSKQGFKTISHPVGPQREGLELRLETQDKNAAARIAEIDAELQKLYPKFGDKSVDQQALMQQLAALQQERQSLAGE
jgi:protocatechuate 3,4-dioxygenase beta subunit